jgi:hypothetical protein
MSTGDVAAPSAPVVCRCLRTKAAFGTVVGDGDWRQGDSSTHVYWCLATMEHVGPDDGWVHPHACGGKRGCYRPRDED